MALIHKFIKEVTITDSEVTSIDNIDENLNVYLINILLRLTIIISTIFI